MLRFSFEADCYYRLVYSPPLRRVATVGLTMFSGRADDRRLVDKEAARPSLTIFHGGGGGIPLARAYRKALPAAKSRINHYVPKNVPPMDHRIMLQPRNFLQLSCAHCR